MRSDSWADDACPIARTMAILGQRWAVLIIREALLGRSRFSEFREQLGVASDVLSARLSQLVADGIFEVVDYREPGDRTRSRYVLTEAGRNMAPILAAIGQWGNAYRPRPYGTGYRFVEKETGEPAKIGFRGSDGKWIPAVRVALTDSYGS